MTHLHILLQVLSAFKRIHRARAEVFAGDDAALSALRINKETYMWDNVPYRDVDLPPARPGGCSDRAS
ncbi:hypothetical protein FJT64_020555 [Amphibalanus amphitrite]|uniref:Uncharacterized protein n=1 Tax=Amphibalanus amphitrite TaxID=1232801 RepID=A0A6A4WQ88_AMPAM|nr:hypothetical protein FJT64_020555 [Amphibalanus amphitrite]